MDFNRLKISKDSFLILMVLTAVILLIPLLAMQFSSEVSWGLLDFLVAGGLLFGFGYLYHVLTKPVASRLKKVFIGVIVFIILAVIWISLALDFI